MWVTFWLLLMLLSKLTWIRFNLHSGTLQLEHISNKWKKQTNKQTNKNKKQRKHSHTLYYISFTIFKQNTKQILNLLKRCLERLVNPFCFVVLLMALETNVSCIYSTLKKKCESVLNNGVKRFLTYGNRITMITIKVSGFL